MLRCCACSTRPTGCAMGTGTTMRDTVAERAIALVESHVPGFAVQDPPSRRADARRPRDAVRLARGCCLARRTGARPDAVHAAGCRCVLLRHAHAWPLPVRRGNPSRPWHDRAVGPACSSLRSQGIAAQAGVSIRSIGQQSRAIPKKGKAPCGAFHDQSSIRKLRSCHSTPSTVSRSPGEADSDPQLGLHSGARSTGRKMTGKPAGAGIPEDWACARMTEIMEKHKIRAAPPGRRAE